ncbi:MAG: Mur ligase domain-containing protein [Candidatus Saccharimonadales bacterium]
MHVYFSGIGGVGIGPLALLALDAELTVSGSDLQASELTTSLEERGANVAIGQDGSHLRKIYGKQPIDWFVYTSALPPDHPELRAAQEKGIKTSKRGDFLNELLEKLDLKMIAVAGTHGKTTTTGMLIWLFKQLDLPVSYSVGTTLSFGPAAQYQKDSEYFIYECDEFDRNFLTFHPEASLITSLDYDHPDTYPTQQEYFDAFAQFSEQSKLTILWEQDAAKIQSEGNLFVLTKPEELAQIALAGEHNRRNAWLACSTINRLGFVENTIADWKQLLKIASDFPGTNRRFEKIAENLYSDYAHHPTEIQATIQMAYELNPNVIVIYQPHQNIRQRELLENGGYGSCFSGAKKVYWLPTYLSREDGSKVLSPEELSATIKDGSVELADMNDQLRKKIEQHREEGDLVVAMSAGNLDTWAREQVRKN